jgi:teichoic acid transport system ATP-binding protein
MVSHNAQAVRESCSRCIWLDAGRLRADGPTEEILRQYSGLDAGTDPGQRPAGQLHVG